MYTLSQAARAVGKSKAAISKAIKSGKLTASKGENGRYIIDPVDLTRVYPVNPDGGAVNEEVNGPAGDVDLDVASGRGSDEVNPQGERVAARVNDVVKPPRAEADDEVNPAGGAVNGLDDDAGLDVATGAGTGEVNPQGERPVKEVNDVVNPLRAEADDEVNPAVGAVNGPVGDVGLDVASGAGTGEVNPQGERPVKEVNDVVNPPRAEANDEVNPAVGAVNDPTDQPNDNPTAEHRLLRAQIDRLTAALEREHAQSVAQIDRLIVALEEERAQSREVATRIEALESASPVRRFEPGSSHRENGADHGSATRASFPEDLPHSPDLQDLRSDIAKMRSAIVGSVQQVNARLAARPGFVARAFLALPVAWCVLSGVYVAGFLLVFGSSEFWRVGQLSLNALVGAILTYWPL